MQRGIGIDKIEALLRSPVAYIVFLPFDGGCRLPGLREHRR